jgi:hypothetical protein
VRTDSHSRLRYSQLEAEAERKRSAGSLGFLADSYLGH